MLGFFSFTEVTDPIAHHAYNEWHQFDHLPEQFSIEGIQFGQRWVCSPRCAEARLAVSPLLARCHYMTLYLLRDADVLPEFFDLAQRLRRAGRFFEARQAHLSGPFDITGQWVSAATQVSAGVVPFRPGEGVYVVVSAARSDQVGAPMHEVPGVAGVWEFVERPREGDAEATPGRRIAVGFVDGDLWQVAAQVGALCGGKEGLEWAGPLERVDPYQWEWFG
jgi:hypothetical protein